MILMMTMITNLAIFVNDFKFCKMLLVYIMIQNSSSLIVLTSLESIRCTKYTACSEKAVYSVSFFCQTLFFQAVLHIFCPNAIDLTRKNRAVMTGYRLVRDAMHCSLQAGPKVSLTGSNCT